jgi:hypothetical protein
MLSAGKAVELLLDWTAEGGCPYIGSFTNLDSRRGLSPRGPLLT